MEFQENQLYHIYNRGNNKQQIFLEADNYIFFLQKIRKFVLPVFEILNYCLMLNHFHFLIYATEKTVQQTKSGFTEMNILSQGFRTVLSSYTQAINKNTNRTGSLFQQNTKSKCLTDGSINYSFLCFHYIHQNPYKASLVKLMEEWEYSSFKDYIGLRNGTLCNQKLAFEILDIHEENFYKDSYKVINSDQLDKIL